MSKLPTPQAVIDRYLEDREKIKTLKREAAEKIAEVERFQRSREEFLLKLDDISIFGFMTDLFVNGRDGKAEKEKEKQDIGLRQEEIEKWLLKMLSLVGEGIRTEFGTVYKTRRESVTVEAWDAFLEAEILRPAAERIIDYFEGETNFAGKPDEYLFEVIERILRESAHFEYLNHAVNKTAILETMGTADDKNGSRPNPPPAGVRYTAIASVGVRKR